MESDETIIHTTEGSSAESPLIKDTFFDDWADDAWGAEHGFFDVGGF